MSLVQNEHALKVKVVTEDSTYQNEHAIKVKLEGGGGGGTIIVDDALSTESENPVQNKVITNKINDIENEIGDIAQALHTINNGGSES